METWSTSYERVDGLGWQEGACGLRPHLSVVQEMFLHFCLTRQAAGSLDLPAVHLMDRGGGDGGWLGGGDGGRK